MGDALRSGMVLCIPKLAVSEYKLSL
jgi:hypothetical protein